jgi:hypothetical protein
LEAAGSPGSTLVFLCHSYPQHFTSFERH